MKNPGTPGWFGDFGGSFVPETLLMPLAELNRAYQEAAEDATQERFKFDRAHTIERRSNATQASA